MKDKYKLKKWEELTSEQQEAIKIKGVKRTDENIGNYMNEDDYTNGSYYVDENENLANYKDVEIWLNNLKSISKELSKEHSDNLTAFDWLTKPITNWWNLEMKENPIFGSTRISNFNKALDKNPNFMNNWKVAENALEGINVMSGGLLNKLSPTLIGRMLIDWKNGKLIFTDKNGLLGSWWGNNGIIPDDFAKEYPYITTIANAVVDGGIYGLGKGVNSFGNYMNGYREIKGGAEFPRVFIPRNPFNRTVYKLGKVDPKYIKELRNSTPGNIPMTYEGEIDGLLLYSLKRAYPLKGLPSKNELRDFTHKMIKGGYSPFKFDKELGTWDYLNNKTDMISTDYGIGLFGYKSLWDKLNKQNIFAFDSALIPKSDLFKKGGSIHIKKKNRGKFTESAKKAGLSVQEHARSVLNNPNATPLQKKRANFARNAAKWKHLLGGVVQFASYLPLQIISDIILKTPEQNSLKLLLDSENLIVEETVSPLIIKESTETKDINILNTLKKEKNEIKKNNSINLSNKKDIINSLNNSYKKALSKKGLDPNYSLALVALDMIESGWGQSVKGRFNFGNITTVGNDWSKKTGNRKWKDFSSLDDYTNYKIEFLSKKRYNYFNSFSANDDIAIAMLDLANKGYDPGNSNYGLLVKKTYNSMLKYLS